MTSFQAFGLLTLALALTACTGADKDGQAARTDSSPASGPASKRAEAGERGGPEMEGSPGVENKEAGDIKMSAEDVKRAGIQVVELQPRSEADVVTVTATVKPNQDLLARIAPRVEGRILRVDANLGDSVRAGQPLCTFAARAGYSCGWLHRPASAALLRAESVHQGVVLDGALV